MLVAITHPKYSRPSVFPPSDMRYRCVFDCTMYVTSCLPYWNSTVLIRSCSHSGRVLMYFWNVDVLVYVVYFCCSKGGGIVNLMWVIIITASVTGYVPSGDVHGAKLICAREYFLVVSMTCAFVH